MAAGPEPHAVRRFVGVDVSGDDHVPGRFCGERFQPAGGCQALQAAFAFVVELIVGKVVGDPDPADRLRGEDLDCLWAPLNASARQPVMRPRPSFLASSSRLIFERPGRLRCLAIS